MCHALVQWQMGRSQSSQVAAGKVCFFEQLGEPQHPQDVSGHISLSLADGGESQVCAWWFQKGPGPSLCSAPTQFLGHSWLGIGMWTSLGVIFHVLSTHVVYA